MTSPYDIPVYLASKKEIQNTECYSVDTDNGVKWFLLVVCYNNHCSQNYKSIYLGK